MSYATANLSDAYPEIQICEPIFADYGGVLAFHGAIVTLKVFEDNGLVRSTLETKGERRVLVVDGGGSLRCALVGGDLGALGVKNGWVGIIVNGCVRDCEELAAQAIGVKALGPIRARARKTCTAAMSTKWSALPAPRSGPGSGCTRMLTGLSYPTIPCIGNRPFTNN